MIKARQHREFLRKVIIYAGLGLFTLFVLFPFAIMLIPSFKHWPLHLVAGDGSDPAGLYQCL